MSVGAIEQTIQRLPGQTGEWGFHVSLGLIGTFGAGLAIESGLASGPIAGGVAWTILTAAGLAFTAAYLTAWDMDERGER